MWLLLCIFRCMTNSQSKPHVTVRCGADLYLFQRCQTLGSWKPWQIYRLNSPNPTPELRPEMLPEILRSIGAYFSVYSATLLEWRIHGCPSNFRALLCAKAWFIDSSEPAGSRWCECDSRSLEAALGLHDFLAAAKTA